MIKLLAIDDKKDNLITIRALLKSLIPDCTVFTAESGKEGIKMIKNELPDVILLDIIMPIMDGYETCSIIKADPKIKHIPVIMVTAIKTNPESRIKGLEIGADAFISKPIDEGELKSQVNVMLRIKRAEDILRKEKDLLEVTVSERTKELSESEERFRTFLDTAIDLILISDKDGRFTYVNEATCITLGYSTEEMIGMHITNILSDKNLKIFPEYLERLIEEGEFSADFAWKTKKGKEIFGEVKIAAIHDENDKFIGSRAIIRDITKRKKAEDKLQESEKRFREMADMLPQCVYEADLQGNLTYVNSSGLKTFGYNKKDLKEGLNMFRLFLKEDIERIKNNIQKIISGEYMGGNEYTGIKKDGTEFPVQAYSTLITKDEKPIGIRGIAIDFTAFKAEEKELIDAKEKAEESDRLKSAFLANMSHEIRTPMNSILGFTELLTNPDISSEDRYEFGGIITNSGNVLLKLIDDIIDISKIEAKQTVITKKNFSLNKILTDLYSYYHEDNKINENAKLSLNINIPKTVDNLHIYSDPTRLRQILTNLIENAFKFTKEGKIEFGYTLIEDHTLQFHVKDTGIGIPFDQQEVIFDRFRQVDGSHTRKYGGAGLGLTITKELVNLLEGKIWLESLLQKGTTFNFTIPYTPAYSDVTYETNKKFISKNYNWKDKVILIVEDNDNNYLLIKSILDPTKATILRGISGKDAVALCKSNELIAIVLMDIQLPEMSGYVATQKIKQFRMELPIIAQTAYAMVGEKELSLQAGCDDYLSKPIKSNELLEILDKYLSTDY